MSFRFPLVALLALVVASLGGDAAFATDSVGDAVPQDAGASDVGASVLHYERALLRHPADGDMRRELADLRRASGLAVSHARPVHSLTGFVSLDAWGWIALLALSMLAVLVLHRGAQPWLRRWVGGSRELSPLTFRTLALIAFATLVTASGAIALHLPDAQACIVLGDGASLRISPFEGAEASAVLPAGTKVHLERTFEGHVWAVDEAGRSGWLDRTAVAPICSDISQL